MAHTYKIRHMTDEDILTLLSVWYPAVTAFSANEDGTFTITSDDPLSSGDLSDIQEIVITDQIWEQVEL